MLIQILTQFLIVNPLQGLEKVPVQVRSVQNEQIQNHTLFWGTYRPNLFFGTRTRSENTLMTGLMWQSLNSLELSDKLRHNCEEWENFKRNGYLIHDSRNFGEQIIEDIESNFRIKTQFVKSGFGKHGGDWGVKISGEVIDPDQDAQLALYYYFGMVGDGQIYHTPTGKSEDQEDAEEEEEEEEEENDTKSKKDAKDADDGRIRFEGQNHELGKFKVSVHGGHSSDQLNHKNLPPQIAPEDISTSNILGIKIPESFIWRVKDFTMNHIVENAEEKFKPLVPLMKSGAMSFPNMNYLFQMENKKMPGANLYIVQKILNGNFEIEVVFNEETNQHKSLDDQELNKLIPLLKKKFDQKFDKKFDLQSKKLSKNQIKLGKFALSNMLGGVGYFQGDSMVVKGANSKSKDSDEDSEWDDEDDDEPIKPKENTENDFDLTEPYSLFTAVPSRTFFPRGFLWDEGFHQLLISEWDLELSISIINSWFNTMTENGWIPREQILGDEARSRVPQQFQIQNPEFANPPTLYLFIEKLAKKLKVLKHKPVEHVTVDEFDHDLDPHKTRKKRQHHDSLDDSELTESHLEDYEMGLHWLKQLYENKLKKNYNWYRTTQRGNVPREFPKANSEVYRWRGRQKNHTLPSGFDDFPRAEVHDQELHSDLTAWIGFMAGVMEQIADVVEDTEGRELYQQHRSDILSNLKNVFFDKDHGIHCDIGAKDAISPDVDDDEEEEEEEEFNNAALPVERECHAGYPTILPFALQLLDVQSPEFTQILSLISDPDHLWSPHGIRSLSKSDAYYRTGEDYWRGNIWMNINYLIIRALHHYKNQPSDHVEEITRVYTELRSNLIKTLGDSFSDTNLVWEQYSDETGKGLRSKPFTGWSSLILLIMSEKYD